MARRPRTIGIVGAGFSGSLLAVHLLRRCGARDRIYLFEQARQFGRGLAYSTGNPDHLLNVRAGNMSAFSDRPGHFVEWLATLHDERGGPAAERPDAGAFVARQQFGAYIQDLLGDRLWREGGARNTFLVNDRVVDIRHERARLTVEVEGGRTFPLDVAVLATGNAPPDKTDPGYFGDPWDERALQDLEPEAPVLLIGTGLTMVDMVVSLVERGHAGPIHAISRRGLLPRRHRAADRQWDISLPADQRSVTRLLHAVRAEVAAAERANVGWRPVIDALRPFLGEIWRGLPMVEKRRFLRHLRPWWEVHRHRMAPAVARIIDDAIDRRQLIVQAGRLEIAQGTPAGFAVRFRPKASSTDRTLLVERIINCSGPQSDYTALDDPLFQNLIGRGMIRPDAMKLGIDVAATGEVIDAEGEPSDHLFALGPLTKGTFWEITAVPDIRGQCEGLADHLLENFMADPDRSVLPFRSSRARGPD